MGAGAFKAIMNAGGGGGMGGHTQGVDTNREESKPQFCKVESP